MSIRSLISFYFFSRFDFQSYLHCSCVYQQHQQNRMVHHQQPPKVWSQSPKSNPGIGKKGLKINWHFDSEVNAGIYLDVTYLDLSHPETWSTSLLGPTCPTAKPSSFGCKIRTEACYNLAASF